MPAIEALRAAIGVSYELLVVYDFDEDPTVPYLQVVAASMPQLRPLRNDLGRGVLNALRAGIAAAHGRYVLITMADGSDDMSSLPAMLAAAEAGAAVVAASRYMPGGSQSGAPFAKSLMSRWAGLSLHAIGALPIHDPTNNFKLYDREFLQSVQIESRGGFELALELTVKAHLADLTMAEVPTAWRERTGGKSNFHVRAWLPQYLRWYRLAVIGRLRAGSVRRTGP
jgi:glycosyltransferase involved in cell wall biosynthesis